MESRGRTVVVRRAIVRALAPGAVAILVGALLSGTHLADAGHDGSRGWVRWCVLLALSFCGWGCILDRLVIRWSPRPSLTLRTTWGLAVAVFLAGVLATVRLGTRAGLLVVVALGWCALVAHAALIEPASWRVHHLERRAALRLPELAAIVPIVIAGLMRAVISVRLPRSGFKWDDAPAYLVFVKQLAQTGHFEQPFSIRRLAAFGGQTALQALLYCDGTDAMSHIAMMDDGLCATLAALLLVASGEKRRARGLPLRLLAAAVLLFAPAPRVNSAAVMSGVLLFVALWTTLVGFERQLASWRALVPVALVASAACSLRQNYIPVVALALTAFTMARIANATTRRRASLEAVQLVPVTLAFLAPWLAMSNRCFRTPLFPLFAGTYNSAASGLETSTLSVTDHVYATLGDALSTAPLLHTAVMLVGLGLLMLPRSAPARRATFALTAAAVVAFVVQVWRLGLIDMFGNARYAFAFEIASVAAALGGAAIAVGDSARRSSAASLGLSVSITLIVAGAALQAYQSRDEAVAIYVKGLYGFTTKGTEADATADAASSRELTTLEDSYRAMQAALPAGARVLTWLDQPYLLDFRRNEVLIGDFPAAVSPRPGMPMLAGEDAVTRYLIDLGIHYVLFVRPDRSSANYARAEWRRHATSTDPSYAGHRAMAPYWLALFDYLDAIAAHHRVVYEESGLVLVDLSQPAVNRAR